MVCKPVLRILLCRARRRKGVVLFLVILCCIVIAVLTAVARCVDEPDRSAEVVELVGLAAAFVVREACTVHAVVVYAQAVAGLTGRAAAVLGYLCDPAFCCGVTGSGVGIFKPVAVYCVDDVEPCARVGVVEACGSIARVADGAQAAPARVIERYGAVAAVACWLLYGAYAAARIVRKGYLAACTVNDAAYAAIVVEQHLVVVAVVVIDLAQSAGAGEAHLAACVGGDDILLHVRDRGVYLERQAEAVLVEGLFVFLVVVEVMIRAVGVGVDVPVAHVIQLGVQAAGLRYGRELFLNVQPPALAHRVGAVDGTAVLVTVVHQAQRYRHLVACCAEDGRNVHEVSGVVVYIPYTAFAQVLLVRCPVALKALIAAVGHHELRLAVGYIRIVCGDKGRHGPCALVVRSQAQAVICCALVPLLDRLGYIELYKLARICGLKAHILVVHDRGVYARQAAVACAFLDRAARPRGCDLIHIHLQARYITCTKAVGTRILRHAQHARGDHIA